MAWYFVLGLLVGWLVEWVIDWAFWRRDRPVGPEAAGGAMPAPGRYEPRSPGRDDNLTAIEGIGPKIRDLLSDYGIRSFDALAATSPVRLAEILDEGGPSFRLAQPETWPEQARLAARGDWPALDRLKRELTGGVRTPAG